MQTEERLKKALQEREARDALRTLQIFDGLVDFSSNDYLGFARNPALRKRIFNGVDKEGRTGSGGSRLLGGNNPVIVETETALAKFHEAESALFFNSGYEANLGLLATLLHRNDTVLYDNLVHASLREGIHLSHAKARAFRHNSVTDLERHLRDAEDTTWIVLESVYSMDGDLCPLAEITALAQKHGAEVLLDEAHATGVFGTKGEGLAQAMHLQDRIFARVHTFGKAIGSNGAAVLGSTLLKDYLVNFCRPFIYTTAPNMMQVIAVREAYRLLQNDPVHVETLRARCRFFMEEVRGIHGWQLPAAGSAIFSFAIPGNAKAKAAAEFLRKKGFDIRAILAPTVPAGSERIRICIHSFNTEAEISALCSAMRDLQHHNSAII